MYESSDDWQSLLTGEKRMTDLDELTDLELKHLADMANEMDIAKAVRELRDALVPQLAELCKQHAELIRVLCVMAEVSSPWDNDALIGTTATNPPKDHD